MVGPARYRIGRAAVSLIPRVGVRLEDVSVGDPPLLTLARVDLSTGIGPLLSRRIEDAEVIVSGSRVEMPLPFGLPETPAAATAAEESADRAAGTGRGTGVDSRDHIEGSRNRQSRTGDSPVGRIVSERRPPDCVIADRPVRRRGAVGIRYGEPGAARGGDSRGNRKPARLRRSACAHRRVRDEHRARPLRHGSPPRLQPQSLPHVRDSPACRSHGSKRRCWPMGPTCASSR